MHRSVGDVLFLKKNFTCIRFNKPDNNIKTSCFACSVWPEQPNDFTLINVHRDAIKHGTFAVGLF